MSIALSFLHKLFLDYQAKKSSLFFIIYGLTAWSIIIPNTSALLLALKTVMIHLTITIIKTPFPHCLSFRTTPPQIVCNLTTPKNCLLFDFSPEVHLLARRCFRERFTIIKLVTIHDSLPYRYGSFRFWSFG